VLGDHFEGVFLGPVAVAEHGVAGVGVERLLRAVEHEVVLTVGLDGQGPSVVALRYYLVCLRQIAR
jgi:hypothetical protein